MAQALLLGAIGSVALVIGGAVGAWWRPPMRFTGVLLAFASGTLISALAFELFPEAVELGGTVRAGTGLLAGAVTFAVVNTWLDARVARTAGEPDDVPVADDRLSEELSGAEATQTEKVEDAAQRGSAMAIGLALVAAVTLDGVPENVALGVSLAAQQAGGSTALLVAIFASNLPESLAGAVAMRRGGRTPAFCLTIWGITAVLLTAAVVVGRAAVATVAPGQLAFALAFAGGAVLASLADTLMPEAFEHGRPLNSLATTVGFFLSFLLAHP